MPILPARGQIPIGNRIGTLDLGQTLLHAILLGMQTIGSGEAQDFRPSKAAALEIQAMGAAEL